MKHLTAIFTLNGKLEKSTVMILVYAQIALLCLLWMFSSSVFLPTPSETLKALAELWASGVGSDLVVSFNLNLEAIAYSTVISLGLAYLTTIPFFRPVVSFISKLRFLSLVGLTFFFTMMSSSAHTLKLSLLVFSVSVFFVTSMADVLNSIPKVQFDLARTLRMGELQVVWEVIILGQADKVFDVVRQNAAISWLMLTMVEGMARSEGGIGAVLLNNNKHFHLSAVMAIQITILLVGLGQDYVIGVLKHIFCPYSEISIERK